MKFLKKTERYFYGLLEPAEHAPEDAQVRPDAENGLTRVRFPCSGYSDWQECERKVRAKSAQSRMCKTLRVRTKSVSISDEDWEVMQGYMVNPDGFKREDFRVYEAWLCHNVVDRDGERFSVDVLRSFEKSLPGKAVLTGHDWNGTGEGRFFRARLEKTDAAGMIKMTGQADLAGVDEQLKQIEGADSGLYWLVAGYYLLADDEAKIRKIDSGIISDMSIGFRAPELTPVKSGGNDILWREYRNADNREAEALEGSHVFLGAQYGARTRKDVGHSDKPALPQNGIDENKLVDEALKLGCLCGEVPFDEAAVKSAREALGALTPDELNDRLAGYREKLAARHTGEGVLEIDTSIKTVNSDVSKPEADERHFRAPAGLKQTNQQGGLQ